MPSDAWSNPHYTLGVDSGSTSTEAVVLNQDKDIISKVIMPTGARASKSADLAVEEVLSKAGLKRGDIAYAISCGYGRQIIEGMDEEITEITCHAKGAHFLSPTSRCVIDIGGQDSKAISLDDSGNVVNFTMNNKCAAGGGHRGGAGGGVLLQATGLVQPVFRRGVCGADPGRRWVLKTQAMWGCAEQ